MSNRSDLQYEPAFARGTDGRVYRLQYRGFYMWSLHVAIVGGQWQRLWPATFGHLMRWGDDVRKEGDFVLVRDLGIRLSGKREDRLRMLGCNVRVIGMGYVRNSNVAGVKRYLVILYGELAPDGSIRVWIKQKDTSHHNKYGYSKNVAYQDGMTTRREVQAFIRSHGDHMPGLKTVPLRELVELVKEERSHLSAVERRG